MRIRHLIAILVAPWLLTAALANPYEMTLKNGLRVIVKEDRRAPPAAGTWGIMSTKPAHLPLQSPQATTREQP